MNDILKYLPLSRHWYHDDYINYANTPELFWFLDVITLFIALVIIYGIYSLIDSVFSIAYESTGKIIDKLYKPDHSSSGTGVGMTSGGQMAMVSTSNYDPEEWFFVVKDDEDNAVIKVFCSMEFYYKHSLGDKIEFEWELGRLSKKRLGTFSAIEEKILGS